MLETVDGYVVYCDLPGMDEKGLELSVASHVLTIKGERKSPEIGKDSRIYRDVIPKREEDKPKQIELKVNYGGDEMADKEVMERVEVVPT